MEYISIDNIISDIEKNDSYKEEQKRLKIIASHRAKDDVYEYILSLVKNLKIEVASSQAHPAEKLIGNLVGWCWQTTESMAVFFPDSASVIRGNIFFSKNDIYYHSWLCFVYKGKQYIFDPCFNYLCSKKIFDKTFEVEEMANVPVKEIRDCMIYTAKNPIKKELEYGSEASRKFMKTFFGNIEIRDTGIEMPYSNDVNAPFYRNNSRYKIEMEDEKIKALTVHYYYNG